MADRRGKAAIVLLALLGAGLLPVAGWRFRLDVVGDFADRWPTLGAAVWRMAVYLVALGAMTVAWLRAGRLHWTMREVLGYGAVVHAVAMVCPPFLSVDPLFYASIGRGMAQFGHPAFTHLHEALPPGDPFLVLLPAAWQTGNSPYLWGFNALAKGIAMIGGDSLALQMRLYQACGAATILAIGAVVGRTAGATAAASVVLCPLAIIEATTNPHNDVFLGLFVALYALAVVRGRRGVGFVALLLGLLVKASAAVAVIVPLVASVAAWLKRRVSLRVAVAVVAVLGVGLLVTYIAWRQQLGMQHLLSNFIDEPEQRFDHCTRSVECLPRTVLRQFLHLGYAAWSVGLGFRLLGGLWLFYCGWRAVDEPLPWLAMALFGFYLYLFNWHQAWYLLSLLPLLVHAPPWAAPAMRTFIVCSLAYYAIRMPLNWIADPLVTGLKEGLEAALVILPATYVLGRSAMREKVAPRPLK